MRLTYAEPRPDGGYSSDVAIVWHVDEHSVTFYPATSPKVQEAISAGVAIGDYEAPEDLSPTLGEVKAALKAYVDAAAEAERGKYITSGSGQAMTYMQKAAEASAYLSAPDPAPADYPLLSAEVGITAATIAEVAAIVNAAFTQWQQVGAAIEAVRLAAKAAIDIAETAEAAQAIADEIVWP